MTIQQRAALVLQQIDDALALAEKTTPGPWKNYRNDDFEGCRIATPEHRNLWHSCGDEALAIPAGEFIAASRTLLPASLRCLKAAIEVFLNDKVWNELYKQYVRRHDSLTVLTTILDQWEAKV